VLRDLWLAREKDPTDPVVQRLLSSAYYNLGVRTLQQGRPDEAAEALQEAAALEPEDEEIARLVTLAETYERRPPDLLYQIFTKYLAPRPI